MGFRWLSILLFANPMNNLLVHPPRDLASLLEPAAVLQRMQVATTDDALIAVLAEKAEAPDEAGADALYVKKLMAIRMLEQTQSKAGLPALEAVASGADITLRDAAIEAVASITGAPNPRPDGAALLKDLSQKLPADTGFVVALDFQRGAKSLTLRALAKTLLAEATAKGLFNAPGEAAPSPEAAAARQKGMEQMMDQQISQLDNKIVETLARIGNVRADAAICLVSPDAGGTEDVPSAFVIKGLYDPERVRRALDAGAGLRQTEIAGREVFFDGNTLRFCLFDANTFIMFPSDSAMAGKFAERLIGALAADDRQAPPTTLAPAFDLVAESHARLAAAGAFTPAWKETLGNRFPSKPYPPADQPDKAAEMEAGASQLLANLIQADSYAAALTPEGSFALQAVCADATSATALASCSTRLQQLAFDTITQFGGQAQGPFSALFDGVAKAGGLWKTNVVGQTVTMKADNVLPLVMGMGFFVDANFHTVPGPGAAGRVPPPPRPQPAPIVPQKN